MGGYLNKEAINGIHIFMDNMIFKVRRMRKYSQEQETTMKKFYESLSEKDRRRYAAMEALKLGYGGQKYICEILGCDPGTVKRGTEELQEGIELQDSRIRKDGGWTEKNTSEDREHR